ncbi:5891_t:CDS:2, partial [Funneliformis caledonium]
SGDLLVEDIFGVDSAESILSIESVEQWSSLLMNLRGIKSTTDIKLAKFLVSEGVLENADEPHTFKMTSTFMDLLVRKFVIPILYPYAPKTTVLRRNNGTIDTLKVLYEAINFFDKGVLKGASDLSYKTAHMKVVGQWHLTKPLPNGGYGHNYCDIVIMPPITCQTSHNQPTIILELLSTTNKELREHFDRVQINFRRREVVWHDLGFTTVRTVACLWAEDYKKIHVTRTEEFKMQFAD